MYKNDKTQENIKFLVFLIHANIFKDNWLLGGRTITTQEYNFKRRNCPSSIKTKLNLKTRPKRIFFDRRRILQSHFDLGQGNKFSKSRLFHTHNKRLFVCFGKGLRVRMRCTAGLSRPGVRLRTAFLQLLSNRCASSRAHCAASHLYHVISHLPAKKLHTHRPAPKRIITGTILTAYSLERTWAGYNLIFVSWHVQSKWPIWIRSMWQLLSNNCSNVRKTV